MSIKVFSLLLLCFTLNAERIKENYSFEATQYNVVRAYIQKNGSYNFYVSKGSSRPKVDPSIVSTVATIPDNNIGWTVQYISSSPNYNDSFQAYWAGYLEGVASRNLSRAHWMNTMADYCKRPFSTYCRTLETYLLTNIQWMKSQIIQKRMNEPYWHQVEIQLWQIKGLEDAFVGRQPISNSRQLSPAAFSQIQLDPFSI